MFSFFQAFNESILQTNFFLETKVAISFHLDPHILLGQLLSSFSVQFALIFFQATSLSMKSRLPVFTFLSVLSFVRFMFDFAIFLAAVRCFYLYLVIILKLFQALELWNHHRSKNIETTSAVFLKRRVGFWNSKFFFLNLQLDPYRPFGSNSAVKKQGHSRGRSQGSHFSVIQSAVKIWGTSLDFIKPFFWSKSARLHFKNFVILFWTF